MGKYSEGPALPRAVQTRQEKTDGLKTPQSVVHIKHRITLQQYKYWVLLLQELREKFDQGAEPDADGFHSMPMAKLADFLGYTPKKSEVWADLLALKNETIAFNVLNKDGEREKYGAGFISEWKVSNSFVRFRFPSFLENVMRGLEEPRAMFSLINWEIFNHFSGKYEAIIYKLCKDYVGVGKTPKMTVPELRQYLGIDENEYPLFKDFNKWVVTGATKKINETGISDIEVDPEFFREGRKVIAIRFLVTHRKQQTLPLPEMEEITAFKAAKIAVSPAIQAKYLEQRMPDEIALCIARANEYGAREERAGRPVNYGALYRRAVSEGWHFDQAERLARDEAERQRKAEEAAAAAGSASAEKVKKAAETDAKARAWAWFEGLDEDARAEVRRDFLEQAKPGDLLIYKRSGDASAPFRIYLKGRAGK